MIRRLVFLLGLGALMALPAQATDGDDCSQLPYTFAVPGKGRVRPQWCVVLCDNDSGNAACTEYDLEAVNGVADVISFYLFERDNAGSSGSQDGTFDCSTGGTVTINTAPVTGLSTSSTNAFDLGSTTAVALGGTRKIVVDTKAAPLDRYIYATTSSMSCTNDSIDLLMVGYEEQK